MTIFFIFILFFQIGSSFIWTPMEVVKGRMQISASGITTFQLLKEIKQTEGMRGFFRGYWMGIVVFLPHSIVWWIAYEEAKKALFKRYSELTPTHYALASASATTVAQTASNLLDVVKTRQQLAVSKEISSIRPDDQQSVFKVARNLIKEVGFFRACFKGLHVRLLQALPSSILSMVIIETLNPDVSVTKVMQQAFEEEEQLVS
jgi:hypothetical protein